MNRIYSIHIPKTAGTSFYQILAKNEANVSPQLRRRDILCSTKEDIWSQYRVIHGHYYYSECATYCEKGDHIIAWIRDPVQRVISNYNFFKSGLLDPDRNRELYDKNKHRVNETLLEYASRSENRNRMSMFLAGIEYGQDVFIGRVEHFRSDVLKLANILQWKGHIEIPTLNRSANVIGQHSDSTLEQLEALNQSDAALYQRLSAICCALPLS